MTPDERAVLLERLAFHRVRSVDLHECQGRTGALPSEIKPLNPEWVLAGWALPVQFREVDNIWLHRSLHAARPGEVIVAKPDGPADAGYWGEIMTIASVAQGLAGLVIDGRVRDRSRLIDIGLPVFCTGLSLKGTDKDGLAPGSIGDEIKLGDAAVQRGDLIFGDEDGVVVVPCDNVVRVIDDAIARKTVEAEVIQRIRAGESTLEIYELPDDHSAYGASAEDSHHSIVKE